MEEQRRPIDFFKHFLSGIIGFLARLWVFISSVFGNKRVQRQSVGETMSTYPLLYDLRSALEGLDSDIALCLFQDVLDYNTPDVRRISVRMAIQHAHKFTGYQSFMLRIGNIVPRDDHRQNRIDVLANIPACLHRSDGMMLDVANYVSEMVMETDVELYKQAKKKFAEFLIFLPASCESNILSELLTDDDRVAVLGYLEIQMKPDWSPACLQKCNDIFSIMAKRVDPFLFEQFWKVVMSSESYSYHGLMAALTEKANLGILKYKEALEFMEQKKKTCVGNEHIGSVDSYLKKQIETQFMLALMGHLTVYEIEKLMNAVKTKKLMSKKALRHVAKLQIEQLRNEMATSPNTHALQFLTRQCVLSQYYPRGRNRILGKALEFHSSRPIMRAVHHRLLNSVLASQSHPRQQCQYQGNETLFAELFMELMSLLPPLDRDDLDQEFNCYQNVLYCLHNLFVIDERKKALMTALDPDWREKIGHATDLHIITSGNMKYDMEQCENVQEKKKLQRMQNIVTCTGQLLVYMFGVLNGRVLQIDPHYMSPLKFFDEDKYTDSFTTPFFIPLTKTQTRPGRRISFPHRKSRRTGLPIELDEDDTDSENEDDDNDEDDDTDIESEFDDDDDFHREVLNNEESNGNSDEDSDEDSEFDECSDDDSDTSSEYTEYTIGSTDDEEEDDFEIVDDDDTDESDNEDIRQALQDASVRHFRRPERFDNLRIHIERIENLNRELADAIANRNNRNIPLRRDFNAIYRINSHEYSSESDSDEDSDDENDDTDDDSDDDLVVVN